MPMKRTMSALPDGSPANDRIAPLVEEFLPLNRRKVQGNAPLSVDELQRWSELSDQLAYELGDPMPAGGEERPVGLVVVVEVVYREVQKRSVLLSQWLLCVQLHIPL